MRKIFISIFIISISFSFVNAESKNSKSDDEFMKEFMQLDKKVKDEKNKQAELKIEKENTKIKTAQLEKDRIKTQQELDESKKLAKTLDEIKNKLNVKWKKDYKKIVFFLHKK